MIKVKICVDCNRPNVAVWARQRCKGCYNRFWKENLASEKQLENAKQKLVEYNQNFSEAISRARAEKTAVKRAILSDYKKKLGCTDCGYNKNAVALDFDHIGEKSFGIASAVRHKTLEQLMQEILKCEVRCANCHRIKTQERKGRLLE